MGRRDEGAELWVPGLAKLMGEELPVLAQGNYINLSTRINFNGQGLGAILSW